MRDDSARMKGKLFWQVESTDPNCDKNIIDNFKSDEEAIEFARVSEDSIWRVDPDGTRTLLYKYIPSEDDEDEEP